MPMVPEAVAAMLALRADRRDPQRRLRRLLARVGARAHGVLRGEGARHRRRDAAPRRAAADEGEGRRHRRGMLDSLEHIIVVDRCGTDPPMTEGRDVFWHEAVEDADPECAPEPMDAEDPLFILYTSGSTGKPKGILHTTGGYLTQVSATHKLVFDLKDDSDVYWCGADIGWVTGHSYIVYGPLANGATSVMYEGAPNYPTEDRWWAIIERYGVTIFYTAPTAIRACMKWGIEHPREARPLVAAPARLGRRADQPARVALVPRAHRRRALPDRRHLVADRDRRDHDRAAARPDRDQAGLGDGPAPRNRGGDLRPGGQRDRGGRRHPRPDASPGRGWRARSTRRTSGSSRPTGTATARTPTWSATPRAATRTATSGSSAGSTT